MKESMGAKGGQGFKEGVVDSAKPLRGLSRMRTAKMLLSFSMWLLGVEEKAAGHEEASFSVCVGFAPQTPTCKWSPKPALTS